MVAIDEMNYIKEKHLIQLSKIKKNPILAAVNR
jgi:hypothetical protein